MRIYGVADSGEFTQFEQRTFGSEHPEKMMEEWLEANPDAIVEEGSLLLIGRQVTTDLGGYIDLLALDREGNVAVVELKRDRTPRDTLAQALEYASFAEQLDYAQLEELYQSYSGEEGTSLAEAHRAHFGLDESEAVSFNKDQRIVIVGSEITPPIRQTSVFLRMRGLRVTCLEFGYFRAGDGQRLLSIGVAVGRESERVRSVTTQRLPRTTEKRFIAACDEAGKAVHGAVLALAAERSLPVHWGSRGYSLNVGVEGADVAIAYGFPVAQRSMQAAEMLAVTFRKLTERIHESADLAAELRDRFNETGLFVQYGSMGDIKFLIDEGASAAQIGDLTALLSEFADRVVRLSAGAKES